MVSRQRQIPIHVIGVGLQGPKSLCPEMLARVSEADLLVGGDKVLKGFRKFPGERMTIGGDLQGLAPRIRDARKRGRRVTVLTSGDPNFFGIARWLLRSFRAEELEIHPYVSSVQLAFARIRVPWDDAALVSAHGRDLGPVLQAFQFNAKVAILTDPKNHPARIAGVLVRAGVSDKKTFVCCRLGGPREQIWQGTLRELAGKRFSALNLMIVFQDPPQARALGIPDQEFAHDRGMITRSEVRAVTLSKLRIESGNILWDVGAGSGSVSVEAARLARNVTVFSVEKSRRRMADLRRNISHFGTANVQAVPGEAPSALKDLPDPDRIFLGGSGGQLQSILRTAVRRLRIRGRIVVNAVTLETLHQTREVFRELGWSPEIISVRIERGHPVKDKTMLQAENPVFVISMEKGQNG